MPTALAADPENRLFGRMNRRRLEAEADPRQPAGRGRPTRRPSGRTRLRGPGRAAADVVPPVGAHRRRARPTSAACSIAPIPGSIVARRGESVVAPQALFFLNDPFVSDTARALAARVAREEPAGGEARIRRLYALALGGRRRAPRSTWACNCWRPTATLDPWERYCQLIFCQNEFLYID